MQLIQSCTTNKNMCDITYKNVLATNFTRFLVNTVLEARKITFYFQTASLISQISHIFADDLRFLVFAK